MIAFGVSTCDLRAQETFSNPTTQLHIDWHGRQIYAPDCLSMQPLSSLVQLKWARTFTACSDVGVPLRGYSGHWTYDAWA